MTFNFSLEFCRDKLDTHNRRSMTSVLRDVIGNSFECVGRREKRIGHSTFSGHKSFVRRRRTTGPNWTNRWRNRVQSLKWRSDNDGIVARMRFGTIHNNPARLSSNHLSERLSKHRRKLNRSSSPTVIPMNGIHRCSPISYVSIGRFHHLLINSSKPFKTWGNFFGQLPTKYIDETSFEQKEWMILSADVGLIKSLVGDERQCHSADNEKKSNSKRRSSSQRTCLCFDRTRKPPLVIVHVECTPTKPQRNLFQVNHRSVSVRIRTSWPSISILCGFRYSAMRMNHTNVYY